MSFTEWVESFISKLLGNAWEAAESEDDVRPLEAVRNVLRATVEDMEEDSALAAFDITFTDPATGEKVNPQDGNVVDVTFSVKSSSDLLDGQAATLQVYHIDDSDGEAVAEPVGEAVTVEAGESGEVSVEAKEFSIYVVDSETAPATATYTYYVDDSQYDQQIVKVGDTLLQPAVPTAPEGQAFAGWYTADGKKFEDFGEVQAVSGNVNLYARFETAYYVFYLDREDKIIATQEYVDGESVRTDEVLLSVGVDEALVGWSVENDGTADEDLRINGANMTLYPVEKDAHWITFHSNGGSVVESMYVVTGGVTVEPEEPERTGYWFEGWYQNEKLTEAFTFGSQLTENIDLYAKWTASQAQYKVVYWQENADDDGYTYTEMQVKTGTVGEEATYDRKNYTGFTLNTAKTEEAATTIAGDGTTVRNVYYERQRYTLTFQVYEFSVLWGGSWKTVSSQSGIKYGAKTNTWWDAVSRDYEGYLWFVSENSSTAYSAPPTMPDNNLTVYGRKEGNTKNTFYYREWGTEKDLLTPFVFYRDSWEFSEEDYVEIEGFTFSNSYKANNRTGYIYYTRNSYDIDFNTNGGPSVSSVTNIPYEADISNRAPSSYQVGQTTKNVNGQTWYFAGWYDNEALAGEPYSFSGKTMPAHDLILYASWTTKTYTVTFDYNDGTGHTTQIDNVPYGSTVAEPEEPTREGYLFAGWTKDGAPFHFTTPISGNTTLVANWISSEGYSVYYDSNGGSAVSDPLVYAAGAKAEVQAQPATGPVNKLFLGWKSSADGKIYYPGDSITVPEGGVTLTAQWGDPQSTTKVIYNANGGTIKEEATFIDTGLVINGVYTVIAEKPTRTNYTFLGWLLADGKTLVQPGDKIQVDADGDDTDNTLTAQWKQSAYEVEYLLDGKPYDAGEYDGSKNAGSTVTVAPKAEKPGYTVTNWTSEDVTISGGSFTMPEHKVTLTATSEINKHDIIYKVNGEVVKTYEVPYDTVLTEEDYGYTYTAPEGYTFSGWNKDLPASMPDADVVIEGTTIINKHTITYQIVGEYFTNSEYKVIEDVEYGTELSLIPDDMTKTGYTFHGWSGLPETMPDHDVTVTGSYTLNQYTITYWVDGKQVQQYTKVNYGTDLTSGYDYEPTPEQIPADKVFVGWMETLPDTMPATNLDLHARLRGLLTAPLTIQYVLKGTLTPIRDDETVPLTENAAAVNVKDLVYQTLSKDGVEGYYVYDSDTAGGNYSYQYGDERNHVLTVYYTEQTYTVEASIVAENADNDGGTITPTRETVNKGDDQTVTWTIDEGYEIVKVEVDGSVVSLDKNSYDFTNISANHTVKVTTRPIEYSVVFQRGESGKLEGNDYENSDWFWRLVDTVKSWILGEDKVPSMNQYTYKFTIEDLNDGAVLSAADIEAKITVDKHAELLGFYRDGDSSAAKYVDLETAYQTMLAEDATSITYVALYDKAPWVDSFRHNVTEDGKPSTAEGNALTGSVKGDGTNIFAWGNETAQYGAMTKNEDGTYRYVLDNTNEDVRDLNAGETLEETFTFSYTDKDGDKATGRVTITIQGVDDYTVKYAPGDHGTWDAENYTTPRLFKGDATPAAPDADAADMHEPGYTFAGWSPERTDTVTGNVTYTALWTANDDTKYTVKYYYQQLEDGSYPTEADDTAERTGTTGDTAKLTAADQKPVEGLGETGKTYALDRVVDNETIKGDGSTVLEVYFKLQFTVKYERGDHGTFSVDTHSGLDYGAETPDFTGNTDTEHEPGYSFNGWSPAVAETVMDDVTYVAQWTPNSDTGYTVRHFLQNADGTYPATTAYTNQYSATTDTNVSILGVLRDFEGYTFDASATKYSSSAVTEPGSLVLPITGDGSLVIDLYYKVNFHSIQVTKSFSGRAALPETFTITNDYTSDVFTIANKTSGSGTAADPYTWTLSDVPYGVTISFQENGADDESTSGYQLSSSVTVNGVSGSSITVPDDDASVVAFTNTYHKVFEEDEDQINGDSFQIYKTGSITGNSFLAGAKFELLDSEDHVVWTGVTTDDGMLTVEIEDSDILNPKDVTGTRSYTLKETAPAGYLAEGPWTVTLTGTERESDTTANSKFYHIYTWTVDSVTASGEQTNLLDGDVLSVLNERQTGSLMIEKVISGNRGHYAADKTFEFTVTAPENLDGKSFATNKDGVTVTFQGSTATVSLVGEDSITIYGLPTGVYEVEEDEESADLGKYTFSVNYSDSDADNSTDGKVTVFDPTGLDEIATMTITNRYHSSSGGGGDGDGGDETDIPDENTPTTDLPDEGTDIPDEETPTTDLPDEGTEIPDEETPLADVPATGDNLIAWILAAGVSGLGLVWLAISGKKRKNEEQE